jgi:Flp pilus assembly pilin Flp
MLKQFIHNDSGTSAVEFAIILMLLMITTFGVMDMGYALWQWNNAEKATQWGTRYSVVSYPVATDLEIFDCGNLTVPAGNFCTTAGAETFGLVVCTGSSTSCTGGFAFSTPRATEILTRMQQFVPNLTMDNLVFEYEDLRLSFSGRGSPVASATVRIVGLNFQFLILDTLVGIGPISMPDFRATLTTEDIDSTG